MLTALSICLIALLVQSGAQTKSSSRTLADSVVNEATALLDAGDCEAFLKKFIPPDELARVTKDQSIEQFAAKFKESHAPRLLKALKATKDVQPQYLIRYTFKEPVDGVNEITIQRIGDSWYFKN